MIEEKNPTLELLVRDALYDVTERPRVWGKRDGDGQVVVPVPRHCSMPSAIIPALRLTSGPRSATGWRPSARAPIAT